MSLFDTPIRSIESEQEHDAAVSRIELLIDALPGTQNGNELDILVTLADAYEAEHHAIKAPDPLAAIAFRMEQHRT